MNLQKECDSIALTQERMITDFDCGDDDLNEFFNRDAIKYQEQLMGQTYFFRHNETGKVVCAFSLSADSLKAGWLPGSRRKKVKELIPREKSLQAYPAFLIGRLGVAVEFGSQGVGSQLMNFIKDLCFVRYPNIARFLLVDAYNDPAVLQYYQKNGFVPIFSVEQQERNYYKRPDDIEPLRTRFMYYDMILWKEKLAV
jgi:ribosomal protein S18 acetylase RimI-like enzyme